MVGGSQQTLASDIAAAMAWWRDAGVDCAFVDEPTRWIAPPAPLPVPEEERPAASRQFTAPPPPPRPRIGGEAALWPQDLEAFRQWWMEEPSLDGGQVARRVASRGPANAPVMVLVEQPDEDDADRLLSGRQGTMLKSILAAMGFWEEAVTVATVFVRRTPLPDLPGLAEAGLADITRHHVHISAPERLIVLGSNILPLLGNDPAQSAQNLHSFNHEGRTIPLLAGPGFDAMARGPAKAAFWRRWLEWSQPEEIGNLSA